MKKSTTFIYRVEYTLNRAPVRHGWNCKHNGRPTVENLRKFREATNKSYVAGGCNHGLSVAEGVIIQCGDARIVRQSNGNIIAEVRQPMFEVIPTN